MDNEVTERAFGSVVFPKLVMRIMSKVVRSRIGINSATASGIGEGNALLISAKWCDLGCPG